MILHHAPRARFLVTATIVAASHSASLLARDVLPAGRAAVWRYYDDDAAPPAGWKSPEFDDRAWKSGPAPLGFGEDGLNTQIYAGPDASQRRIATWFRREFAAPSLQPGESLTVLLCADDGAVVYVNGRELGRTNMPAGQVRADTLAAATIGNDDEGLYRRMPVPADLLNAGERCIAAVEVRQASRSSSDLYFDLAIKVVPATSAAATVGDAAHEVVTRYNRRHFLGPGTTIPDGYIDGGRHMQIDGSGSAVSGREILTVDRIRDRELADDLAFARSAELRSLPTLERAQRLAAWIDRETTPPAGLRMVGKTTEQLELEFAGRPVLVGDWVDQCHAGVCRHRALLFKLLADEAGLRAALVRGNFLVDDPPGEPHAWNEVTLDDGRRVLVDVMHHGGKPKFPPLSDPKVVERYRKVDGTPWYDGTSR